MPQSSKHANKTMYLYAWDALDAGISRLCDELQSSGYSGIKFASVYHTGKLLLANNPKRRVFVPEDGVCYFRHSERFWKASPLQVPESALCRDSDVLNTLCSAAADRNLTVDAWVVCLHNRAITATKPNAGTMNVFGNVYGHSLCPMNPAVRAYLSALIDELTSRAIRRVVLEALLFVPYKHYALFEIEAVQIGAGDNLLLSLCFCPSCLAAFPRLSGLRGPVGRHLESFFNNGAPSSENDVVAAIPGLDSLLAERIEAITALTAMLTAVAHRNRKELAIIASLPLRNTLVGVELARLAAHVDAIEFAYYDSSSSGLAQVARQVKTAAGQASVSLLLRPSYPDTSTFENLNEKLAIARSAGFDEYSFYNYGILPRQSIDWLKRIKQ